MKTGRTQEAEMLHARDMSMIEDVSADALPTTIDDDNAVIQGAQKYQQARPKNIGYLHNKPQSSVLQ